MNERSTLKTIDPEDRPALADRELPEYFKIFLEELKPGGGARRHPVLKARTVIGREDADVALDDPKLSRKHAVLEVWNPGHVMLRDLASTNGTFVNDRIVDTQTRISRGDVIRVGDTRLLLVVERNPTADP